MTMNETITRQNTRTVSGIFPDASMLDIRDLKKSYSTAKGEYTVLSGLNLQVMKEEFISIIGHSGCGKSTLLSMIAGLIPITAGQILLGGKPVTKPGPDRGVVFQSPSLLPWMTTLDNVLLAVEQVFPHASERDQNEISKYYLDKVGLGNAFNKKAAALSQGMQQRVGIARAFALKPRILLLDEPFGMLDSLTRATLQNVLLEIWNREKITAIMVTHDVDESIFLSDRVIMMTTGPQARIGDILEIPLERPRLRREVIEHPDYYHYRGHLIQFLDHKQ